LGAVVGAVLAVASAIIGIKALTGALLEMRRQARGSVDNSIPKLSLRSCVDPATEAAIRRRWRAGRVS
jgi:hypothetical protein